MHPILKRILVNGLLTAGALAVVGVGYAELAGIWIVTKTPVRKSLDAPVASDPPADALASSLQYRVPAMMAMWGFLFVAAGEGVLYWWRGNRPAQPPKEPKPDAAEVLLEQILAQVEAARATPSEATPSPSPVAAENSPVAH